MRLDKYLKISRIIKRRTIAKQIADQGRISINGKVAKSSNEVKVGDILLINFGNKDLTVKILEIKESTKKQDALNMFEIIKEEYKQDFTL